MSVTLVLSEYPYNMDGAQLEIRFSNVRDFKLGDINVMFDILIQIDDISDHKWENCRYKVYDVEEDAFFFYCEDIKYKCC